MARFWISDGDTSRASARVRYDQPPSCSAEWLVSSSTVVVDRIALVDLYSPFDKTLAALDVADLSVLYSVPEGWYIEYKRETVPPKDLA